MKKLLSTITVIAIIGILAAVGFFGYNKYQEVELEKNKLQAQQKENENSNSQNTSELSNNENQSNESKNNHQKQAQSTSEDDNSNEQQVTRDNVFDYLFAGLNEMYDGEFDKDLITFQNPTQDENGDWVIMANNKSGHGSYTFRITPDGLVQHIDNAGGLEDYVQVNLD